ncbi:MAG TPA: flagellar type III secretion system pore protein FliP [Kineosporiaceae bacterium]|nr:flagellar type III secretion system pore protein FliP [Kineosporiaceae bacterium]
MTPTRLPAPARHQIPTLFPEPAPALSRHRLPALSRHRPSPWPARPLPVLLTVLLGVLLGLLLAALFPSDAAWAVPKGPGGPTPPAQPSVSVSVPGQPSTVVTIILLTTVLGAAPAILLLCTSFTKIIVVLSLARSAIGTQSIPPNQVLVGLALFLSLFVMGPTLDAMNSQGLQPYLAGSKTSSQAYQDATVPLREFMLKHTRDDEIALMTKAAGQPLPKDRKAVELRTLVPAFVLSELRAAFIIGFVVFVPFLVVDLVVSAILMSLGMVMLPPSIVSLPFKLLLFVMVDGWTLIVTTLIGSYH